MIHMRNKSILACMLIVVLLFVGSVASAASASSCTVTASKLILREEANSNSEALASIRQGTVLEIIGKTGKWYKVTYGNYTGYVYSTYVELIEDGTLTKGSKGDEVKALQQRLKELGYYDSTCDGNYGTVTVNAVKAFQKKNGLTQDGIANSDTLKKLNSSSAITAKGTTASSSANKVEDTGTLKKGSSGTAVKQLQQRLKELGYYKETCDGDYGNQTVNAVKAFQKKNGLTQTGTADATTLKKLNSTSAVAANDKSTEVSTDTTLKQGSKGTAVKQLQQRLKELGYYKNTIDGDYGSGTVTAVKAFQKKNGLTQTGIADAATLKKVYATSAVAATEGTTTADTTTTLKSGSKGTAVKQLQQRLKELGYYTSVIDSDYGNKTVTAVKAFQKKNGLAQTGTADAATLKKVYATSAVAAKDTTTNDKNDDGVLKSGSKGTEVKELQTRLKELGYYKSAIDGDFGSGTVTAVKAFQKNNGLTQTGIVDAATQKKLDSDSAVNASGNTSVELNTSQTLQSGDSGAQVKALQLRLKELGYYTTNIDSDYGYQTASAVSAFQRANSLNVTGIANPTTLKKLVSSNAVTKSEADAKNEDTKTYVTERLDWFKDGKATFPKKAIIQVKDVRTGLIFKAQVLYGTNHLDVEPCTKADTAILLKINGGAFSYKRRPMLVKYDGHVYAASIYSEPHGEQSILDNNFDGQFCLHFYGSKLHKLNEDGVAVMDTDHQACVAEAMKATW